MKKDDLLKEYETIENHVVSNLVLGIANRLEVKETFKNWLGKEINACLLYTSGKEVGADIPFCIYQKIALVSGVGEKLEFIKNSFECKVLLVKPKRGVSTKKSFTSLDLSKASHQDCRLMATGIEDGNYQIVIDNLQNTLEAVSYTHLDVYKRQLSNRLFQKLK